MNKLEKRICSIPYYRKGQYDRLREVSIDKENFLISYEEMMTITESKHKEMENKGFKVMKIDVDIEELIEWCNSRCATLNPESRTRFTLEKLKEMISNNVIDI
jgi:hypothetical protein